MNQEISAVQAKKTLWLFPIGTLGRDMVYSLFTNYILLYVLFTRELSAAQLVAITVLMVAARVFDALNDPVMGNIIERTRTRWGKYKPWLLIGIVTTSIVVYLAFNVKLQGWPFVTFFGIIYFCYSITYTMHDIAYWGMIPSLSSEAGTRDRLTARTNLVAGIGAGLAGLLIPLLTTGSMSIGGNAQTAYGFVALVFVLLAPAFLCFTIFGVRENRGYMSTPAPKISFRKIISTIGGNDQLLWISLIFLLQQIGTNVIGGGIGSTYIYFTFGYEGGLYSLFSTVGLSVSAVLLILYPTLSKKWHRKELLKAFFIVACSGYIVMLFAGLLLTTSMMKFWVLTVGYMFSQLGQNCFYVIMMISIINTVEYNEYMHGTRDEAIISSLRPFLTKMASAFTVVITTVTYLIFGVTNYTNKISALEQQTNLGTITEVEKLAQIREIIAKVSHGQTLGLLLAMYITPFLFMLASYLLYMKHYTLDEEEYERLCAEIRSRHAS